MKTENLRNVTLDQITELPVYPVADLFPMLSEEAVTDNKRPDGMTMRELAESIRDNGLQEPIVLFDTYDEDGNTVTMLLDGRNRRQGCIRAAKMSKVEHDEFDIQVENFIGSEEEADEFVLTLNIDRRNMTPGQRAFVAVEYWDLEEDRHPHGGDRSKSANLRSCGKTAETLAQRFRVGTRSIEEARAHKKKLQQIEDQIELDRQEVERQKTIEAEAKIELEAAREVGDTSRVKDAAHKVNKAASVVSETEEKLEQKSQAYNQKSTKIKKVKDGKESLNSLKTKSPGQEINDDDPLAKFRSQLNSAGNKFQEAADELLDGGRPEDRENVRLKYSHICERFDSIDEVELQTQHYFPTEREPSDEASRWAGEVRIRLGGIDQIIKEKNVIPSMVTKNIEFLEVVYRLRGFLDEVEKALDVEP